MNLTASVCASLSQRTTSAVKVNAVPFASARRRPDTISPSAGGLVQPPMRQPPSDQLIVTYSEPSAVMVSGGSG